MSITIKSMGDSINILLGENVGFEAIAEELRKKVSDAKQFFEGASTNVSFQGRKLSDIEEQALLNIITSETTMDVTLVDYEAPVFPTLPPPRPTKERFADSVAIAEKPPPTDEPKAIKVTDRQAISYKKSETAYHNGGLRSGQSLKFNGSVVVLGDVNPGSEIVASGNVIVLGALKGMAHAGAGGDTSSFVSALALQPTQLRIANIITSIPSAPKKKNEPPTPSIAYVKEGQVFVGPL